LQYTWQCLFNKPFAVFGEYMVNVDSNAEDKINAWNPFLDPDILYDSSDDIGWVAGAQLGEKPVACGDWYAFARYKEIGANAVIDGFADYDAGGANTNSLEVHWAWMWRTTACGDHLLPQQDAQRLRLPGTERQVRYADRAGRLDLQVLVWASPFLGHNWAGRKARPFFC